MCAPLTWGHSPLVTSAAQLCYQRQGAVGTYGVSTEKTPWDLSRSVQNYPDPWFPALLHATDWLKDYSYGYGLEVPKIPQI